MDIARSVAIDLLKDKPDGTFVVRPAGANKVHKYTLDLVLQGQVRHMAIYESGGKLAFNQKKNEEYTSLEDLVSFFSDNELIKHNSKLTTTLKKPLGYFTKM